MLSKKNSKPDKQEQSKYSLSKNKSPTFYFIKNKKFPQQEQEIDSSTSMEDIQDAITKTRRKSLKGHW